MKLSISTKLESGRGVLVGMGGVGVEEAAAVGAQHLDRFLRGDRPLRDRLLGALERMGHGVGVEVLRHTLPDQEQPIDDADGQQQVEHAAHQIDPEGADAAGGAARQAAHQGHGPDDAHGRGEEVVGGQAGHLGEIAHGRFAAVVLPVGVGGEADGGVPGQERRHVGQVLRVEERCRAAAGCARSDR